MENTGIFVETAVRDYKVIVTGGRNFADYTYLSACCDRVLRSFSHSLRVIIVSGHAKGRIS